MTKLDTRQMVKVPALVTDTPHGELLMRWGARAISWRQRISSGVVLLVLALGACAAESSAEAAIEAGRKSSEVTVISLSKQLATTENDWIAATCRNWTLTKRQVRQFFSRSAAVTGQDIHYSYNVFPCDYVGTIRIAGEDYRFRINSGATGTLQGPVIGDALLYGCMKECAGLFPFGEASTKD